MLQDILFWAVAGLTAILFFIWVNKYKQFRKNLLPTKDRLGVVTLLPTLIIESLLLVIIYYSSINTLHLLWAYPLVLFGGQFIIGLLVPKSITKKWQDKE